MAYLNTGSLSTEKEGNPNFESNFEEKSTTSRFKKLKEEVSDKGIIELQNPVESPTLSPISPIIQVSASCVPINPNTLSDDGFELQDQEIIPQENITGSFIVQNNVVELFIYDADKNLSSVNYNYTDWSIGENTNTTQLTGSSTDASGTNTVINNPPTSSITDALTLDPTLDVFNSGFDNGQVFASYNFINYELGSNITETFYISEISGDRTEISIRSNTIEAQDIIDGYQDLISKRNTATNFDEFYVSLFNNQYQIAINLTSSADLSPTDPTILIKLYEPLAPQFGVKDELYVATKVGESVAYKINFVEEFQDSNSGVCSLGPQYKTQSECIAAGGVWTFINANYIKGPNINISLQDLVNNSTVLQSKEDLLNTASTASLNNVKNLLNTTGVAITPDYSWKTFNEFVNFSSAKERVNNFYEKVSQIQAYEADIESIQTTVAGNPNVVAISQSLASLQTNVTNLIENFDGYETYLYYNTSSLYAYPKTGSIYPFELLPTNSVEVLSWLGSDAELSVYYGGIISSASLYDENNQNWLYYTIPQYILDNNDNVDYVTFCNMIGQSFDEVWLYTKALSERYNTTNDPDSGLPLGLAADAIKGLGFETFGNNYNNQDNFIGLAGADNGIYVPPTGSELITKYVAVNQGQIINYWDPGYSWADYVEEITDAGFPYAIDRVSKEIYKRLYHNMAYLTKKKGTISGLRQLINIWGIPNTILRINEFGGKNKDNSNDYDLWYNRFSYAYTPVAGQSLASSSVRVPWMPLERNYIANINASGDNEFIVPDGVGLRFKTTGFPSSSFGGNFRSQSLMVKKSNGLEDTQFDWGVSLVYNDSPTGSYSGSSSSDYEDYGRLSFFLSGSVSDGGTQQSDPIYLPFFDKGWWTFLLQRDTHVTASDNTQTTTYTLFAGNNQYNGADGNTIGWTGSSSITINGASTPSLNSSWNDFGSNFTDDINGVYVGGYVSGSAVGTAILQPEGKIFSGSLQEFRYYSNAIGQEVFNDFVMNPESIEGNAITGSQSSFDIVNFRAPLGNELEYLYTSSGSNLYVTQISSSHPAVTGSAPSVFTQSFINPFNFTTTSSYDWIVYDNLNTRTYSKPNYEVYQLDQPAIGIRNRVSNKIQVADGDAYGKVLSTQISIDQDYLISRSYTEDTTNLEVAFSPQDEVNDDIIATYGFGVIADALADPQFATSSLNYYPKLRNVAEDYFKKYTEGNVWDYLRLIKYFDNSLFKAIKSYVPARTSVTTGVVIKQHMLERNRRQPTTIGSYTTFAFSVTGSPASISTNTGAVYSTAASPAAPYGTGLYGTIGIPSQSYELGSFNNPIPMQNLVFDADIGNIGEAVYTVAGGAAFETLPTASFNKVEETGSLFYSSSLAPFTTPSAFNGGQTLTLPGTTPTATAIGTTGALVTQTSGQGTGATIIVGSSNGTSITSATISGVGSGYVSGDTITVLQAVMNADGSIGTVGGDLVIQIILNDLQNPISYLGGASINDTTKQNPFNVFQDNTGGALFTTGSNIFVVVNSDIYNVSPLAEGSTYLESTKQIRSAFSFTLGQMDGITVGSFPITSMELYISSSLRGNLTADPSQGFYQEFQNIEPNTEYTSTKSSINDLSDSGGFLDMLPGEKFEFSIKSPDGSGIELDKAPFLFRIGELPEGNHSSNGAFSGSIINTLRQPMSQQGWLDYTDTISGSVRNYNDFQYQFYNGEYSGSELIATTQSLLNNPFASSTPDTTPYHILVDMESGNPQSTLSANTLNPNDEYEVHMLFIPVNEPGTAIEAASENFVIPSSLSSAESALTGAFFIIPSQAVPGQGDPQWGGNQTVFNYNIEAMVLPSVVNPITSGLSATLPYNELTSNELVPIPPPNAFPFDSQFTIEAIPGDQGIYGNFGLNNVGYGAPSYPNEVLTQVFSGMNITNPFIKFSPLPALTSVPGFPNGAYASTPLNGDENDDSLLPTQQIHTGYLGPTPTCTRLYSVRKDPTTSGNNLFFSTALPADQDTGSFQHLTNGYFILYDWGQGLNSQPFNEFYQISNPTLAYKPLLVVSNAAEPQPPSTTLGVCNAITNGISTYPNTKPPGIDMSFNLSRFVSKIEDFSSTIPALNLGIGTGSMYAIGTAFTSSYFHDSGNYIVPYLILNKKTVDPNTGRTVNNETTFASSNPNFQFLLNVSQSGRPIPLKDSGIFQGQPGVGPIGNIFYQKGFHRRNRGPKEIPMPIAEPLNTVNNEAGTMAGWAYSTFMEECSGLNNQLAHQFSGSSFHDSTTAAEPSQSLYSASANQNTQTFIFSPNLPANDAFYNTPFNALINNATSSRLNTYIEVVEYEQGEQIPSNLQLIIDGTAPKAAVPDSNYVSKAWINPRYNGTLIESANYNQFTPKTFEFNNSNGKLLGTPDALLSSLTTNVAGGVAATYTEVLGTGSAGGVTCLATITLSDTTTVSAITITTTGSGFSVDNTITFPSSSLGASAAGGTDPVFTLNDADLFVENTGVEITFLNALSGSNISQSLWPGDNSYGDQAVINHNPLYFAHFKTSYNNLNLEGTYTFEIDALIEVPTGSITDGFATSQTPAPIDINGSGDRLIDVKSTFEINRGVAVTYDSPIFNEINYASIPAGIKTITQGAIEYNTVAASTVGQSAPLSTTIVDNISGSTNFPSFAPTMSFALPTWVINQSTVANFNTFSASAATAAPGANAGYLVTGSKCLYLDGKSSTLQSPMFSNPAAGEAYIQDVKGPGLGVINSMNTAVSESISASFDLGGGGVITDSTAQVAPGIPKTLSFQLNRGLAKDVIGNFWSLNFSGSNVASFKEVDGALPFIIKVNDEIECTVNTEQSFGSSIAPAYETVVFTVTGISADLTPPHGGALYQAKYTGPSNGTPAYQEWSNQNNVLRNKVEVYPDPSTLNIQGGQIGGFIIRRRVNADDRVIVAQQQPNALGAGETTGSGGGYLVPNDFTQQQKTNTLTLINQLKAQNAFRDDSQISDPRLGFTAKPAD